MGNYNFSIENSLGWNHSKPDDPHEYDAYYDMHHQTAYVYYNNKWVVFSTSLTKSHERYLKLKELGFDENTK